MSFGMFYVLLFVCQICDSRRSDVKNYDLKKRQFIANTSMDPLLSLIMANMGHSRPAAIMCDPFVGSGESISYTYLIFNLLLNKQNMHLC